MDDKQRVEIAERHLANVQGFYPRIDTRVGAVFAISSAQLAIAAVNLSLTDFDSTYVLSAALTLIIASAALHISLYICTFPKLVGGSNTTMFFGHIAKQGEAEFSQQYRAMTMEQVYADLTRQIWRSSHILSAKYHWLKVASIWLALATASWLGLLVAVSLHAGKLPILK